MSIKGVLILVLVVLCLVIFFQNTEVVSFKVFFWELSMSRIILLLITLIVGIVIGYVLTTVLRGRSSRT
jgi:uncharacterized integral membrane protein